MLLRSLALALALLGLAAPALAQRPEAEARLHARLGKKAFNLGQFEEALAQYSRAYDLKPLPALLFNIAQCHRSLGHWERAAFFFKRYLELSPSVPDPKLVNDLIAEVEAKQRQEEERRRADQDVDRQRGLEEARAAAAHAEAEAASRRQAEIEARRAAEVADSPVFVTAPPPPPLVEPAPVYKKWWLWAAVVVVVAGAAGASAYAVTRPRVTSLGDANFP